jgi:hypothetical protein
MTLLELLKEFCTRRMLPIPQIVMSSQDDTYLQLVGLANEVLDDLMTRGTWTQLQKEASWTSTGTESQGALTTLAPAGFKHVIKDTFYDRTQRLPVFGPKSPQEWQLLKAVPMTGPFLQYRIQGGNLLLNPVPPAGHSLYFEYASNYSIQSGNDTTIFKRYFSADNDIFLLDQSLLLSGLSWRWKKEKGFAYAEDFRTYETLVVDLLGVDGTKKTLSMDGGSQGFAPGIFVPMSIGPKP